MEKKKHDFLSILMQSALSLNDLCAHLYTLKTHNHLLLKLFQNAPGAWMGSREKSVLDSELPLPCWSRSKLQLATASFHQKLELRTATGDEVQKSQSTLVHPSGFFKILRTAVRLTCRWLSIHVDCRSIGTPPRNLDVRAQRSHSAASSEISFEAQSHVCHVCHVCHVASTYCSNEFKSRATSLYLQNCSEATVTPLWFSQKLKIRWCHSENDKGSTIDTVSTVPLYTSCSNMFQPSLWLNSFCTVLFTETAHRSHLEIRRGPRDDEMMPISTADTFVAAKGPHIGNAKKRSHFIKRSPKRSPSILN